MVNKESQHREVMSPVRQEMDRQTSVFTPVLCYPLWGPFHLAGGSAEGHGPPRGKAFHHAEAQPRSKEARAAVRAAVRAPVRGHQAKDCGHSQTKESSPHGGEYGRLLLGSP